MPRLFEALAAAAKGPINSVPRLAEALFSRSRPANDPVFDKLRAAAAANAGRTLVTLWDENAALVAGHPSVAALTPIVAGWRNRNRLCDAFLALARKPGTDAGPSRWHGPRLDRAGGHPEAEAYRSGLQPVAERLVAWSAYQAVPRDATEHFDQQRLAAWREGVFAQWPDAERERPRIAKLANGSNWSPGCGRSIAPASPPKAASSRSWLAAGNCRPTMHRPGGAVRGWRSIG